MSGTDVASLVGTWVAAGVAIVALVGVIGPILVWRASRGVRHKALVKIGTNNNGYVSKGITVWPGIRFFQKVSAPRVRKARKFTSQEWTSFDLKRMTSLPESPATWVQYGACLQCYGLKLDTTAEVNVQDGRASIPVSREHMTLFLLLGRYNDKIGKQHIRKKSEAKRLSTTPTMTMRKSKSTYSRYGESKLYGLTGTMTFIPENELECKTLFTENLDLCEPLIEPETLPVASLLMFLYGFLPLPSGKHICFSNPEPVVQEDESSEDEFKPFLTQSMPMRTRRTRKQPPKPKIVAFEITETTGPPEGLEYLVRDGSQTISVISAIALERSTRVALTDFLTMTYVPATEKWIRIEETFIRRHDAQLFALALLSMSWHPQGYVISGLEKKSSMMEILCRLAERAPRLIHRLKKDFQALGLSSTDVPKFLAAADAALEGINDMAKLLALDEVLQSFQRDTLGIQYMIGVLTLTNEEFHTLVYQSARYLEDSSQTKTELDLGAGTLRVPSAFGVVQVFEIDVSIFDDIPQLALGQTTTTVAHSRILLGALRAYVRSLMLSKCIDAQPITDVLADDGEVFMMS